MHVTWYPTLGVYNHRSPGVYKAISEYSLTELMIERH